ncbi:MAG TPA: GNAT family N-acetyltransferase [Candidatus Cybelea sp.]|jgi:RimJ/RimL family protein N-acetyltransferase|nr:GNAT family N-acetyltransferase [Candidatus Cybelea sp.]
MRTIRTTRLRLVPVTATNAGMLWRVLQEPDLRQYQDLPDVNRDQFTRVVGSRPTRFAAGAVGRFEWLVHFIEPGEEPIGWVSLRIGETNRAIAEIGYSVVQTHRGRGIASEAVAALVDEGFNRARLREIRAYCLPENSSSRAVLRRNGFQDQGTLTRGATVQGKPVDVIAHSLERARWESRAPAPPS